MHVPVDASAEESRESAVCTCSLEAWCARLQTTGLRLLLLLLLWRCRRLLLLLLLLHSGLPCKASSAVGAAYAGGGCAAGLCHTQMLLLMLLVLRLLLHGREVGAGAHVHAGNGSQQAVHAASAPHGCAPVCLRQTLRGHAGRKAAGPGPMRNETKLLLLVTDLHERGLHHGVLEQQGVGGAGDSPCGVLLGRLLRPEAGARAVVAAHRDVGVLRLRTVHVAPLQRAVDVPEAPVSARAVHAAKAPGAQLGMQRVPGAAPARQFQPTVGLDRCRMSRCMARPARHSVELHVLLVQEWTLHRGPCSGVLRSSGSGGWALGALPVARCISTARQIVRALVYGACHNKDSSASSVLCRNKS